MADVASGLVCLDKPAGVSSFAALTSVKRECETRKVGHTGTLDPFASGLLIALVGKATRAAQFLSGLGKSYRATITFGSETATDDLTGETVATAGLPDPAAITNALPDFLGMIEQIPPAYSAVHVNGSRAYKLARRGEAIELKPRSVMIHEFKLENWSPPEMTAVIRCSTGTYIRALARDLGRSVCSAAHLSSLSRTTIGPFSISEAISPEAFRRSSVSDIGAALLRIPNTLEIAISESEVQRVSHGADLADLGVLRDVSTAALQDAPVVIIRCAERTVALATWDGTRLGYSVVLSSGGDA